MDSNKIIYNLTDASNHRCKKQVDVKLQYLDYTETLSTKIGLGHLGWFCIDEAIYNIYQQLIYDYDDECPEPIILTLVNDFGHSIDIDLNVENDPEQMFRELITAVEISEITWDDE